MLTLTPEVVATRALTVHDTPSAPADTAVVPALETAVVVTVVVIIAVTAVLLRFAMAALSIATQAAASVLRLLGLALIVSIFLIALLLSRTGATTTGPTPAPAHPPNSPGITIRPHANPMPT
jgi:hypothetical protein